MNKKKPTHNEKKDSDEEHYKERALSSKFFCVLDSESDYIDPEPPKESPDNKTKKKFIIWIREKFKISKKQERSISIWVNIVMLGAFISFSWCQNRMTRQAIEISDSTMKNTIDISRTDMRPYLCFKEEKETEFDVSPHIGTYRPVLIIKNYGRTPAFDFDGSFGIAYSTDPNPDHVPFIELEQVSLGAPMVPPGMEWDFPVSTKVNSIKESRLDSINSNKLYLYIGIYMIYNQHVGNKSIPHKTTFCVFYDTQTKRLQPHGSFNSDK